MARSIWTGVITFGLASLPVGLYTATEDHSVTTLGDEVYPQEGLRDVRKKNQKNRTTT
ncbi:hypothetical protein [Streptomyces sp. NBC_01236]|uniref:hypothetical protein n=1 Tax=Streptomyces sp. NBC_01236 TaxID=2903789 RepID=UPI002E126FAE|nr:hypothetical protein OG324_51475 [Streptomyces sp. NBC_01236]